MTVHSTEDAQQAVYEIAEAIAPSWESRREAIEDSAGPVRGWLLANLAPQPGETILELAAGVGDTGFGAAGIIGEGGRLLTTDFSPTMLAGARRRGAELGVENVEYRVIDAQRIELETDSVDGALCRFGYMLMPDPGAALSEARRVVRPGGRLALAVWGAPERNPYFGIIATALVQRGTIPPPEPPPAPGIFSMASPERTTTLLESAGFGEVRTEEVPVRFRLADVDAYVALIADTAGPIGLALQRLSDGERAAIGAEVADSFERFASEDGYVLPGSALCALAG